MTYIWLVFAALNHYGMKVSENGPRISVSSVPVPVSVGCTWEQKLDFYTIFSV